MSQRQRKGRKAISVKPHQANCQTPHNVSPQNNLERNELKDTIKSVIKELLTDDSGSPKKEVIEYFDSLETETEKRQTDRSAIASNFKAMLNFIIVIILLSILTCIGWVCYNAFCTHTYIKLLILIPLALLLIVFGVMKKETKTLSKSDSTNMFMFILSIISIIEAIVFSVK